MSAWESEPFKSGGQEVIEVDTTRATRRAVTIASARRLSGLIQSLRRHRSTGVDHG